MEVNKIGDENADVGSVRYFIDDDGHYYYQSTMETQHILSLDNVENTEDAQQSDAQMLIGGERFQKLILVPTEIETGVTRYIFVEPEDIQTDGKINDKVDQQENGNSEYTLNDKVEDKSSTMEIDISEHFKSEKSSNSQNGKHNISRLTCGLCTYTTSKNYLLTHHMKSHSEKRQHKCSICEQCFKTLRSLQSHLNKHNGVKPKICKYCQKTFTNSGALGTHVRYKHTLEKPYKCKECDYAFVELAKLQRHVRSHTGERPYQCPQCTYASADTFKLKRHLRIHTGEKPYKCVDCNMCFSQANTLKAHKFVHNRSEKKVFPCELCPSTCGRKIDLRIHVKNLHSFQKPLKCMRCGKVFSDRYSWKIHNKTHEGEKRFKCKKCPYTATTSTSIRLHMIKHIDEKLYSCDECNRTFKRQQLLRRHHNLIHDPDYVPRLPMEKIYTCHECKRNYARRGNLIRHLAMHDPELNQQERQLNLELGEQKLIEQDKKEDIEKMDFNKEDSEKLKEEREVKLDEEDNKLKREETVTEGETDDQLQYVVIVVDDLQLMEEEQKQVAPEYGIQEEQE